MDAATLKTIAEFGSTVVLAALFAWMLIKEIPAQRREAADRFDKMIANEQAARTADRVEIVKALSENTRSNALLSDQIERVCKHPGQCPRIT